MKLSGYLYVDDSLESNKAIKLCNDLDSRGLLKVEIIHVDAEKGLRDRLQSRFGFGLYLPMLESLSLGNYSGYRAILAYFGQTPGRDTRSSSFEHTP